MGMLNGMGKRCVGFWNGISIGGLDIWNRVRDEISPLFGIARRLECWRKWGRWVLFEVQVSANINLKVKNLIYSFLCDLDLGIRKLMVNGVWIRI